MTYIIVGDTSDADDIILDSAPTLAKAQQIGLAFHAEDGARYDGIRVLHAKRGKLSVVCRIVMQEAALDDPAGWLAVEQQRLECEYRQFLERLEAMSGHWYGHMSWPVASLPQEAAWALEGA